MYEQESKIEELVSEYNEKRELYRRYANTVEQLLKLLLEKHGFRYYITSSREKDPDRLRKKLKREEYSEKKLEDISDLAGCRVIFNLERDIAGFAKVLHDEFVNVIDEEKIDEAGYNARHLDVCLGEDRTKLTEYQPFVSLRCEIQLTSVLYHAWSALYHDDIYKDIETLRDFHRTGFDKIEDRFKKVMQTHIGPASNDFDYLWDLLQHLKQSKEVLTTEFISNRLLKSTTLSDLYSSLKLYNDAIGNVGDKPQAGKRAIDVIAEVMVLIQELKETTEKDTLWVPTYSVVMDLAMDTLDNVKYYYCEESIKLCLQLYTSNENSAREKAEKILSGVADFRLSHLKNVGYYFQDRLIRSFEELQDIDLVKYAMLLRNVIKKVLSPVFTECVEDYEKTNLSTYSLNADEHYRDIRERSFTLLKRLFNCENDSLGKRCTLQTLVVATQTPVSTKHSDELDVLVLKNTETIIEWYSEIVDTEPLIFKKEVYNQTFWFNRRFGDRIAKQLEKLIKKITKDEDFGIFDVLVGHEILREPDKDFDIQNKKRLEEINGYVKLAKDNQEQWKKTITKIARHNEIAIDEYWYYRQFLTEIGMRVPTLALELIAGDNYDMQSFRGDLMLGLIQSPKKAEAKRVLDNWITAGTEIRTIADIINKQDPIDVDLMKRFTVKAIELSDQDALTIIVKQAFHHDKHINETKQHLINALTKLYELNDTRWTFYLWGESSSIIESLNESETSIMLKCLTIVPRLDYPIDKLLQNIADKSPEQIIQFFRDRCNLASEENKIRFYDAIPDSLEKTQQKLLKHWDHHFPRVIEWYQAEASAPRSYAAEFVHFVFPIWNNAMESSLMSILEDKAEKSGRFILDVLQYYCETESTEIVACEYLKIHGDQKDNRRRLTEALTYFISGSVEGGLSKTLKRKAEWISKWDNQDNPNIKAFIEEAKKRFESWSRGEGKRASQELYRRKANFELKQTHL